MNQALEFALFLAKAAEPEIMSRFRECAVNWKPDGTEVTDADRRAEALMRELIATRLPGHTVLGEEYGGVKEPAESPQWVLDPIDGTASFAVGLPIFGTLIGYLEKGEPQVGVIHFPALGETVYAAKDSGCWVRLGGAAPVRVHVSNTTSLANAYVSACSVNPSDMHPQPSGPAYKLSSLIPKTRRFRFISDCVQHALVAQGRIDAAIDTVMNPWDIAAIVPCIEEAGGVVTDLDGNRERIVWRSSLLSTCSRSLHDEILRVMRLSL